MGGDFAPEATVLGAIAAYESLESDQHLVLIGNKDQALPFFKEKGFNPDKVEFIHTTEVIGMGEHPTKAITQKPDSSICVGFRMLKEGFGIMLDVGANADCKPDTLLQFGVLGSLFAENILGIKNPKIGLINIGEEEEKGNLLTQATYSLMKDTSMFNFIGNVEGRDLFNEKADVIVCDGFTGNVMLKLAETFYILTLKKGFKDEFFAKFNYEQYGGSPILGVNAPVIIGHGISPPEAIKNMILLSRDMVETKLIEKITSAFK